eukprot:2027663-Pleurochrysis_carterae.AAC.8
MDPATDTRARAFASRLLPTIFLPRALPSTVLGRARPAFSRSRASASLPTSAQLVPVATPPSA